MSLSELPCKGVSPSMPGDPCPERVQRLLSHAAGDEHGAMAAICGVWTRLTPQSEATDTGME